MILMIEMHQKWSLDTLNIEIETASPENHNIEQIIVSVLQHFFVYIDWTVDSK